MKWLIVATLGCLPVCAEAQDMTRITGPETAGLCQQMETTVRGAAAMGQVLNRGDQSHSYRAPAAFLQGDISRIDGLKVVEADTWGPRQGNAFAMVVCRGTLVLTDGRRVAGTFSVERPLTPGDVIVSWFPGR